jgi:hypothetical protein
LAPHGRLVACHDPSGPTLQPGLVRRPRARGIRGATLGFNPKLPPPPSLLCRRFFRKHPPVPHLVTSSASVCLTGAARRHRCCSSPLHSTTDPPPSPWPSGLVRKIPSPRSMTRVARFHEVGEVAKDSTPDGAPERWLLTGGGGILWWWRSALVVARRWWGRGGDRSARRWWWRRRPHGRSSL